MLKWNNSCYRQGFITEILNKTNCKKTVSLKNETVSFYILKKYYFFLF